MELQPFAIVASVTLAASAAIAAMVNTPQPDATDWRTVITTNAGYSHIVEHDVTLQDCEAAAMHYASLPASYGLATVYCERAPLQSHLVATGCDGYAPRTPVYAIEESDLPRCNSVRRVMTETE